MKVFLGNEVSVELEIQDEFLSPALEGHGEIGDVEVGAGGGVPLGGVDAPLLPDVVKLRPDRILAREIRRFFPETPGRGGKITAAQEQGQAQNRHDHHIVGAQIISPSASARSFDQLGT